jgi:hypothetical protein
MSSEPARNYESQPSRIARLDDLRHEDGELRESFDEQAQKSGYARSDLGKQAYWDAMSSSERQALANGDFFSKQETSQLRSLSDAIKELGNEYKSVNKQACELVQVMQSEGESLDVLAGMSVGEKIVYGVHSLKDNITGSNSKETYLSGLHVVVADRLLSGVVGDYDRQIDSSEKLRAAAREHSLRLEQEANKAALQLEYVQREWTITGKMINSSKELLKQKKDSQKAIKDPSELYRSQESMTTFRNGELLEAIDRKQELGREALRCMNSLKSVEAQLSIAKYQTRVVDKYLSKLVSSRERVEMFRQSRKIGLETKIPLDALETMEKYEGLEEGLGKLEEEQCRANSTFLHEGNDLFNFADGGIYSSLEELNSDLEQADKNSDKLLEQMFDEVHNKYFG